MSPAGSSRTSRPVAASHRRTLLPSAAAISWPSGEKRATNDVSRERFQWPNCRAGIFQVPDSGRLVGAGRDEPLAIARKTDGRDRPLMALERQQRRALRVQLLSVRPDLDRPFGIRRGQLRAVAGEGHRRDGRRVSGPMLCDQAACGCVENDQRSGQTRADSDPLAIRTQRGGTRRSTEINVLCQRSHCLRGRVQAEDRKLAADGTVADDGQRQTIGRQGETASTPIEFLIDGCDHLAAAALHHRILSSTMTNRSPSA